MVQNVISPRPAADGDDTRRPRRFRPLVVLGVVLVVAVAALFVIIGRPDSATPPVSSGSGGTYTAAQQPDVDHVIAEMVSVFENGTPEIQYAYVENLDDGRGYTAGRAGFCTACGDLLTVVKSYTAQVPDNPLARYLPTLTRLAAASDDSTNGLDGFERRLAHCRRRSRVPPGAGPRHRRRSTARPPRKAAQDNGVRSALGLAILVDTAVQQGTDDDPDGLPAMVRKTNADVGGDARRRRRRDQVAAGLPRHPPRHPGEPQLVGHQRRVERVRRSRRRPPRPARRGQPRPEDPLHHQPLGRPADDQLTIGSVAACAASAVARAITAATSCLRSAPT